MDARELDNLLTDIVEANLKIIQEDGLRSIDPLMGIVMKTMRGKADGQIINKMLMEKIREKLNSKN